MNRTDYNRAWQRSHPEKCAAYYKKWRLNNAEKVREITRGRKARRKAQAVKLKEQPCMDCGIQYPHYVMDFDHRPGTEKDVLTRKPQSSTGWARSMMYLAISHPGRFEEQVKNCDVVCSNCHRVRTHERRDWGRRYSDAPQAPPEDPQLNLFGGLI